MFHELATNSAKYGALSTENGKLSIEWREQTDHLEVSWSEAGGPEVRKPERQGFGTKVIRATVEGQHNGHVSFHWLREGLRCVFTIALTKPLLVNGDDRKPDSGRGRVAPDYSEPQKVLLVEDEILVGLTMRDALEESGIPTIGPFNNVADALARARSEFLSAAVLDINLNGELVYPLAEFLVSLRVPFVFVSGYGGEYIDGRFRHIPLLRKPVSPESLKAVLQEFLSGLSSQNEIVASRSAASGEQVSEIS